MINELPSCLAVIGLGYVGLPLAAAFGRHLPTIGFDVNPTRIQALRQGADCNGELQADALTAPHLLLTDDPSRLREAAFLIVAVPTPVDRAKRPDLGPLIEASRLVGRHLSRGAIVVYESTVYPGCTEEVCVPVLEREAALLSLLGQDVLPDPDTVGDWLRRMGDPTTGQAGLVGLGQVRDALTARLLRRDGVTEYTLDVDATLIEAEKREAQWSYQGVKGYMPLLGFLFETPVCLVDEFRDGNISPGAGRLPFYRACQARMPHGKRIAAYRADSASYQAELINVLEADGVRWAITADQDAAVKGLTQGLPEEAWQEPVPGCGYEVAETVHTMNKSTHAFRLIVKRERRRQPDLLDRQGYVYHAVASNWPAELQSAHEVLRWHNQRGQAENFHKELKLGCGLERMPCGESWANAVFFRLGVLAYNLFIGFKRLACPAAWAAHTIATVRWRLIQVAGRIIRHAGQVILKLVVEAETLTLFQQIRRQCAVLAGAP